MSSGALLFRGPGGCVPSGSDGNVPGHRDPHIRVGLHTEGNDGDANEKNRDDPNDLDNAVNCKTVNVNKSYLSSIRGVRLIKQGPDPRLSVLPPANCTREVIILESKSLGNFFVAWLLCVQV